MYKEVSNVKSHRTRQPKRRRRQTTTAVNLGIGLAMQEEPFSVDKGILHHEEGVDLMPENIELSAIEVALVDAMVYELHGMARETCRPSDMHATSIWI